MGEDDGLQPLAVNPRSFRRAADGRAMRCTSWMTEDWKPPLACRDHLLAGCICFSVFTFLAWISAVSSGHHLKATLSEMVYDWDTAEGKIFIPALLLPAIFFLLSGYPYVLPNARVDDHPLGHTFVIMRHFFVNAGLVLIAFVPTLADVENRGQEIEVYIHSFAATLAFVSFVSSELFVLTCHPDLDKTELSWRQNALSLMTASTLMLAIHKTILMLRVDVFLSVYCEAWTFRYEMLLGAGLISQCQLIWYFCDPEPSVVKDYVFYCLACMPYIGVLVIICTDFAYRGNEYALPWAGLEIVSIVVLTFVVLFVFQRLRGWGVRDKSEDREEGYGAVA